ncbi:tyrosine-type recombinase/integrase [Streptomyces humicola]|uniref:tyrosine-type recombinase/integrase n=1 Tax=Streptomyces humicola TaxID=2953240 RepID=UPI003558C9AD
MSPRVAAALTRHAARTPPPVGSGTPIQPDGPYADLVFCRPDGRPLRPEHVLRRFRRLTSQAGVPRISLHDLRHLAATLTINAGVPLTVVSKTLRHSTLSTTANIYSHLTTKAARDAVDAIDQALTQADPDRHHLHWPGWLRPHPDHLTRLRKALTPAYSPAPAATSPNASQPRRTSATTLRPPPPGQRRGRLPELEKTASDLRKRWSGRQDLNLRPLDPQARAVLREVHVGGAQAGAPLRPLSPLVFLRLPLLMSGVDVSARSLSGHQMNGHSPPAC